MTKYIALFMLLLWSIIGLSQCKETLLPKANSKLEDYTYLKDVPVALKEVKESKDKRQVTVPVMLNKGTKYRFVVEDSQNHEGKLVFELFGERGRKVTSYLPDYDKHFSVLEFVCTQSGMYFMNFEFTGAKEGCGVVVYGFKKL